MNLPEPFAQTWPLWFVVEASLDAAQDALDGVLKEVKSARLPGLRTGEGQVLASLLPGDEGWAHRSGQVDGVASVQRVVCGGCLDFKARFGRR